jgi:hypothetical protein
VFDSGYEEATQPFVFVFWKYTKNAFEYSSLLVREMLFGECFQAICLFVEKKNKMLSNPPQ